MPTLFLVHAAQVYSRQPPIQKGYNQNNGGFGTVNANANAHPTLHAHASISTKNLSLLLRQSSAIQSNIFIIVLFIIFYKLVHFWECTSKTLISLCINNTCGFKKFFYYVRIFKRQFNKFHNGSLQWMVKFL